MLPLITATLSSQKCVSPQDMVLMSCSMTLTQLFWQGKYPFPVSTPVVPTSDGAGTVVATGSRVTRFKKGDAVVTLFNQSHLAGSITLADSGTGLGGALDGALRQYGSFDESGLVKMPSTLDFKQGSTLSCAALTAWNGLYGVEGKRLMPGDTILTQGTGGVSMFALQVRASGPNSQHSVRKAQSFNSHHSSPKQQVPASFPQRPRTPKPRLSRNSVPITSSTTNPIRTGARPPRSSRPVAWVVHKSLKLVAPKRWLNRSKP